MKAPVAIEEDQWFDTESLCAALKLRPSSVERARREGTLRSTREGGRFLYRGEWVDAWLSRPRSQNDMLMAEKKSPRPLKFTTGETGYRTKLASFSVGDRVLIEDEDGGAKRPGRVAYMTENVKGRLHQYLVEPDDAPGELVLAGQRAIELLGPALPGQGDD